MQKSIIFSIIFGMSVSASALDVAQILTENSSKIISTCESQIVKYRESGEACLKVKDANSVDLECLQYLYARANRNTRDFDFIIDGSNCKTLLVNLNAK